MPRIRFLRALLHDRDNCARILKNDDSACQVAELRPVTAENVTPAERHLTAVRFAAPAWKPAPVAVQNILDCANGNVSLVRKIACAISGK